MEPVMIYGKPDCPYCEMAVKFCEERDFAFTYVDIFATGMDCRRSAEKSRSASSHRTTDFCR